MTIDITMPRLSDTMEAGTIIKWNVSAGDSVSAGDVIADIETDKATMEMQVFDDGEVAEIRVSEGETVDIGTVIAILAEDGEDAGEAVAGADQDSPAAAGRDSADQTPATAAASSHDASATTASGDRQRVSPVARRLAEEHGIDLRAVQGSGPSGRIIKRDILKAVDTGAETVAAVPPAAMVTSSAATVSDVATPIVPAVTDGVGLVEQRVPLSNMRQTIARRLVESKTTIPHYQVSVTFAMDALMELRHGLNGQLASHGVKLSVNDFIVRACALAMHEHPEVNASWGGDAIDIHGSVNVGVAISMPRERGGGLVVATIRDADRKSLRVISAETKALAEKARTRGLTIEEMSDATFTISNLGMFGVEHFTAIINPPNSAILAVGSALQKPVVRDGELAVGYEMTATMSSDHRLIDGAMAAEYLNTLREMLETPAALLVQGLGRGHERGIGCRERAAGDGTEALVR